MRRSGRLVPDPKAGASADERLLRSPRLPHSPTNQKAFTCRRPLRRGIS
nr:MAG TPA_asm: hypothetical protein [Caudoviricetes sp.]